MYRYSKYFLNDCFVLLDCSLAVYESRVIPPSLEAATMPGTTRLDLQNSFGMLHLVNKLSSMVAVDTATKQLILHDPPS